MVQPVTLPAAQVCAKTRATFQVMGPVMTVVRMQASMSVN
jgi:hypothetical protein